MTEPMSQDEQEALSFRYVMPRVMRLTSGRFALFIEGQELQIIQGVDLPFKVPSCDTIEAYHQSILASRPKAQSRLLTSLNLADLGL